MAIKKSDLYSSLWASRDELLGGMDASQYKDYVADEVAALAARVEQHLKRWEPNYDLTDEFRAARESLPATCT